MKVISSCVVLFYSQTIFAGTDLRQKHESEIISIQQREISAREQIAQEQIKIESLKHEFQNVTNELSNALNEKYALLGVDERGLRNSQEELGTIKNALDVLLTLDPPVLLYSKSQVDSLNEKLNGFRGKKIIRISSIDSILRSCESILLKIYSTIQVVEQQQVKNQSDLPENSISNDQSVINSDQLTSSDHLDTWLVKFDGKVHESLYKIAGNPEVYGDPTKWPKLYEANKELIDSNYKTYINNRSNKSEINPHDILFPGQTLKIPRK